MNVRTVNKVKVHDRILCVASHLVGCILFVREKKEYENQPPTHHAIIIIWCEINRQESQHHYQLSTVKDRSHIYHNLHSIGYDAFQTVFLHFFLRLRKHLKHICSISHHYCFINWICSFTVNEGEQFSAIIY